MILNLLTRLNNLNFLQDYKIGDRRYCNNCDQPLPIDHSGIDICDKCKGQDMGQTINKQENIKISIGKDVHLPFKRASND